MGRYEVGDEIVDLCNMCKIERPHTVAVADGDGVPIRNRCDHCRTEHPYAARRQIAQTGTASSSATTPRTPRPDDRTSPSRTLATVPDDLESALRRIVQEELGLTPTPIAERWRGGELVLRPGKEGLQEKAIPIEAFFNKITMVRNRLRLIEAQINSTELPSDVKAKLQSYLTASYGSLTSFNILFAEQEDRFKGAGKGS